MGKRKIVILGVTVAVPLVIVKAFTLVELIIISLFITLLSQTVLPPGFFFFGSELGDDTLTIQIASNITCQICSYPCNISRILPNITEQLDLLGIKGPSEPEISELLRLNYDTRVEAPSDGFPPSLADGICVLDPDSCVPLPGCIPPVDPCNPAPFNCVGGLNLTCCIPNLLTCNSNCLDDCFSQLGPCIQRCVSHFLQCLGISAEEARRLGLMI